MDFVKYEECDAVTLILSGGNCCSGEDHSIQPHLVKPMCGDHNILVRQDKDHLFVHVGDTAHPTTKKDHIEWIMVKLKSGGYFKMLSRHDDPDAVFIIPGEVPLAVYAYCSEHGLLMKELK